MLARLKAAPESELVEPVEATTRLANGTPTSSIPAARPSFTRSALGRCCPPCCARVSLHQSPRLAQGVVQVLQAIGAAPEAVARELAAMTDATLCRTASRQVLGSMTDFALMMAAYRDQGAGRDDDSTVTTSVWLADTPCGPLGMDRLAPAAAADSPPAAPLVLRAAPADTGR